MWRKDFVKCLETSTLGQSRVEEAFAIKQQNMPRNIYKYRRDCEYSRDNLIGDTIWFCSPDSYNDPYDCVVNICDERFVIALKRRLVQPFVSGYKLDSVLSKDQIENALKSSEPLQAIVSLIPREHIRAQGSNPDRIAEFTSRALGPLCTDALSIPRQWRKLTKVCSFSEVNDSILMWSHYADNHQGFCLEYDLASLEPNHQFRKYLYPVIYSKQLYDLTPWAEKLAIPDRQQCNLESPLLPVLHKFDGWEYEKEWRLVEVTRTVITDHNWSVPTPTRIFLGSRVNAAEHKDLLAICKHKKIEVHQMVLREDRFELAAEPWVP